MSWNGPPPTPGEMELRQRRPCEALIRRAKSWNPRGFYPTPHAVAECMARMLFHDIKADGRDSRTRSVNEPAVGSGRMLLHVSNYSMNLAGQDVDPLAVKMCLVN